MLYQNKHLNVQLLSTSDMYGVIGLNDPLHNHNSFPLLHHSTSLRWIWHTQNLKCASEIARPFVLHSKYPNIHIEPPTYTKSLSSAYLYKLKLYVTSLIGLTPPSHQSTSAARILHSFNFLKLNLVSVWYKICVDSSFTSTLSSSAILLINVCNWCLAFCASNTSLECFVFLVLIFLFTVRSVVLVKVAIPAIVAHGRTAGNNLTPLVSTAPPAKSMLIKLQRWVDTMLFYVVSCISFRKLNIFQYHW